jgi:hypothetical protein
MQFFRFDEKNGIENKFLICFFYRSYNFI